MKKTHSLTPPILPLLRALGRHRVGCQKAAELAASLSAAKAGWRPEPASRPAVRVRTHARGERERTERRL